MARLKDGSGRDGRSGSGRRDLRTVRAMSAGGIVVRPGAHGPELVLGSRRRERDGLTWTLPKGTPDPGETVEQTALREVTEETGLDVEIVAPAGAIEYWFVQGGTRIHKTVHYFLMRPTGGDLSGHDHEFDEVRWVEAAAAESMLSFPTERDIVARAADGVARLGEPPPALRRTALHDRHRALGARIIAFSGWEMPVQYAGILDEHRAVRERAGLFDLSHMGEVWVEGAAAGDGLAFALVTDPRTLAVGRAQYSTIVAEDGGMLDDLIVYRVADARFLVVPNASNAVTVVTALRDRLAGFDARLDDATLRTSLVAVQGPRAREILAPLTDVALDDLRYYAIAAGHAAGVPAWIARTGYTGEDGFELFVAWDDAPAVWDALLDAGAAHGIAPAGLGARDTLRLEAGMALYGNELDRRTNPYEANLGRLVKLDKPGGFVGRDALARVAADGPRRRLVGLAVRGRGIARHGYPLHAPGEEAVAGEVTSGTASPTLGIPIAMGYLPPAQAEPGTMVEVAIRASRVEAEVVPLPFYKRQA